MDFHTHKNEMVKIDEHVQKQIEKNTIHRYFLFTATQMCILDQLPDD